MNTYSENRRRLWALCEPRQIRKLRANYGSAANLHAAMIAAGVGMSDGTAQALMRGERPSFLLLIDLIDKGFWPTWKYILRPILDTGGLAALKAERAEKINEVKRHDAEIEALERARASRLSAAAQRDRTHRV